MTENLQQKVCIIGAGPVGYTAAITALELGYSVELVDPWVTAERNLTGNVDLNVKTRFGSSEMYAYPSEYISGESDQTVAASSVVGGFSTVWGAGLSFDTTVFGNLYDSSSLEEAKTYIQNIFRGFDQPHYISRRFSKLLKRQGSRFLISQLAVSSSKCKLIGDCMTGCSENAIWSCEAQWKELILSRVTLRQGFAKTIKELEGQVEVTVDDNESLKTHEYDFVMVACGALASAALGQRSSIFPEIIEISETEITYLPFIFANQLKPYLEKSFTLSQVFFSKQISREKQSIWLSLFESSNYLREQATLKLGRLVNVIPRTWWGYLGVAIYYSPEFISNKIVLSLIDGTSKMTVMDSQVGSNRYFWQLFRNTAMDFYRFGILLSPGIRIKGKVGASFHLGHVTKDGKNLLDSEGKTRSESRVTFVDSLSLQELPTGPITAIAMMNARLKTNSQLMKFRQESPNHRAFNPDKDAP